MNASTRYEGNNIKWRKRVRPQYDEYISQYRLIGLGNIWVYALLEITTISQDFLKLKSTFISLTKIEKGDFSLNAINSKQNRKQTWNSEEFSDVE